MNITSFAAAVCAGAGLSLALFACLARRKGIGWRTIETACMLMMPLGVICGHLLYCGALFYEVIPEYGPTVFLTPWTGGFMFYGVFAGCAAALWITARITDRKVLPRLADCTAPALLLLVALIRLVEPLDGQGKGMDVEAGSPIAFFPLAFPDPEWPEEWNIAVFFFEALWALVSCALVMKEKEEGKAAKLAAVLYASGQILLETLRRDRVVRWRFTRVSQILSAVVLLLLLLDAVRKGKRTRKQAAWSLVGFMLMTGAVVALEFAVDKPLKLPNGELFYFSYELTYSLIGLCAAGMGILTWMAGSMPEFKGENGTDVDSAPHCAEIFHTDSENGNQRECTTSQCNIVLFDFVHDNHDEHRHKYDDCDNTCWCHGKTPFLCVLKRTG